jgi:hypothetical protein
MGERPLEKGRLCLDPFAEVDDPEVSWSSGDILTVPPRTKHLRVGVAIGILRGKQPVSRNIARNLEFSFFGDPVKRSVHIR